MSHTHFPSASLPPAPDPDEPVSWPRRRRRLAALAIGVVVALVAGVAVVAITRGDSAEAQPLALSFTEGQHRTYELHQRMDATVSSALFGHEPVTMDLSQVVGWEVTSVDREGIATINVTVSDLRGTLNGEAIPPTEVPPVDLEIAPDGRVVSADGLALGGAGQAQGLGFPGMEQLTPILPDEGDEVSVGDTWDKEFSQPFPFGEGTIGYAASSTYVRNETLDGRDAAVIETRLTFPLAFTLSFAELLKALGPELTGSTGPGGFDALGDARIDVGGQGGVTQTSFVDLAAKELLRMRSRGEFDVSMEFAGVPGLGMNAPVAMGFSGTFSQDLELR